MVIPNKTKQFPWLRWLMTRTSSLAVDPLACNYIRMVDVQLDDCGLLHSIDVSF
jgi:hypothetical protein